MAKFDMPNGTWEQEAGWVVNRLMDDVHLKDYQASGLVGGFGVESVEFTKLHEIGQPENVGGYGWAQWTGPRRRDFFAWCKEHNLDWRSREANYGFLVFELTHTYGSFLRDLRETQTLEEATHLAHRIYERPQEVLDGTETSYPQRFRYAQRALAGSRGQPHPDEPPVPPVPTGKRKPLTRGDRNNMVQAAQVALGINPDGQFGPATEAAVQKFQSDNGIKATGKVDRKTWTKLFRWDHQF